MQNAYDRPTSNRAIRSLATNVRLGEERAGLSPSSGATMMAALEQVCLLGVILRGNTEAQ